MSTAPQILPLGTQVVTLAAVHGQGGEILQPRGAVGVVVKAPLDGTHSHRIRFPDGSELALARTDLAVRKEFQRQEGIGAGDALDELDLRSGVIYRCVVGSRAYGLDHDGSDVDRRSIYLPPADLHWSLFGVPEQLEDDATQECYWELQKFLVLAFKANPNVLECLFSLVRP